MATDTEISQISQKALAAIEDQLKRGYVLPYIWWHTDQKNWWLSTDEGSKAIGGLEEAAIALSEAKDEQDEKDSRRVH